jgi:hypothetical protein
MLGSELTNHFKTDLAHSDQFIGILGAEEVKTALRRASNRTFCVVNVDRTSGEGTHWYCVFKHAPYCYDLMDSLGVSEEEVKSRLGKIKSCFFNETRVQAENSALCGPFCAYFVFCRLTNFDMTFNEVFAESFTSNLATNEKIVAHFWETGEISEDVHSLSETSLTTSIAGRACASAR